MAYSIRTKYCLDESNTSSSNEYVKQLYIRNKNWNPPPAPTLIEEKITEFEKLLKKSHKTLVEKATRTNSSNLTPLQAHALKSLKNNKNIVIKPTDKNLGPAVIDLKQYLHQILNEHLLSKDYKQLTRQSTLSKMEDIKNTLKTSSKNTITHSQRQKSPTSNIASKCNIGFPSFMDCQKYIKIRFLYVL
jgi:hypothetical protein